MTLKQYVTLIDALARLHLKGEARKFFLGYLWWLLEPALYIAVFYLVFQLLLGGRQPDFLYFLAVGKLTFIWFSKSVTQAAISVEVNKGLIAQTPIRKEIFPLATVQQGLYRQLAVFAFLFCLLSMNQYGPSLYWLWLLPVMVIQLLLITACGLVGALLVSWHRDFQYAIQLGMLFLLFVSGVFWDVEALAEEAIRHWLFVLNPVAVLIDAYRQVLLYRSLPDMGALFVALVQSAVLLIGALSIYRASQSWIALRVVNR